MKPAEQIIRMLNFDSNRLVISVPEKTRTNYFLVSEWGYYHLPKSKQQRRLLGYLPKKQASWVTEEAAKKGGFPIKYSKFQEVLRTVLRRMKRFNAGTELQVQLRIQLFNSVSSETAPVRKIRPLPENPDLIDVRSYALDKSFYIDRGAYMQLISEILDVFPELKYVDSRKDKAKSLQSVPICPFGSHVWRDIEGVENVYQCMLCGTCVYEADQIHSTGKRIYGPDYNKVRKYRLQATEPLRDYFIQTLPGKTPLTKVEDNFVKRGTPEATMEFLSVLRMEIDTNSDSADACVRVMDNLEPWLRTLEENAKLQFIGD